MDFQGIAAILFILLLTIFLIVKRKKIELQKILFPVLYFAMYKTKLGLRFMDSFAQKFKKPLYYLSFVAIFIGFAGMLLIAYTLFANWIRILTVPASVSAVVPVLPFKVKGALFVPFFYWIISIFIVAVVHEVAHGVIARANGLKIKSSGFAFLGILFPIIPAAFVEPDEEHMNKLSLFKQLSIFAAGPFSNILLGFICLGLLLLIIPPISSAVFDYDGVIVAGIINDSLPAGTAGIKAGEIVTNIDGLNIMYLDNFSSILEKKNPGDTITLTTNENSYNVTLAADPGNASKSYLGVFVQQSSRIKESFVAAYGSFLPAAILWFMGLIFWLYLLNLGIGLFNLVPLGPIDGGRMLKAGLGRFFSEKTSLRIWKFISGLFLFLILANLLFAFIR